jgi:hypothetical protein
MDQRGIGGLLVAAAGHEQRSAEPKQEYETMHDSSGRQSYTESFVL